MFEGNLINVSSVLSKGLVVIFLCLYFILGLELSLGLFVKCKFEENDNGGKECGNCYMRIDVKVCWYFIYKRGSGIVIYLWIILENYIYFGYF